jgi:cytochrome c556
MMRALLLAIVCCAACQRATPAPTRAPTPLEAARALDARTPVPLLPRMAEHQKEEMRGHLAAVQEIVAALAKDDFAAVEQATKKIGSSDAMTMMCSHMGAGAAGFTPAALQFHRTADTVGEAARRRDRAAALSALATTLGTCVSCHATYRQDIVDEATFAARTQEPR